MELLNAVRPGANQYVSGEHVLNYLETTVSTFKEPVIITGNRSLEVFQEHWNKEIIWPIYHYDESSSEEDMARLAAELTSTDLIIGIGGGRVLDTVKGVADLLTIDYVLVPTLISNCAPYTPVIAVYHPDHSFKKISYCKRAPFLTLVDWTLLLSTPKEYLIAGIGDTLAKWYEINGITASMTADSKTAFIQLGIESAKEIQRILFKESFIAIQSLEQQKVTPSFNQIADTIIALSGTVGGFAGIYGRCAGAHAIHNGLSYVPESHSTLHGAKVAYGILVQLAVTGETAEIKRLLDFYQEVGLPTSLADLNITTAVSKAIQKTAEHAVSAEESFVLMRPEITSDEVTAAMVLVEKLK